MISIAYPRAYGGSVEGGAEMKEGPTMLMKTNDSKIGFADGPTISMKLNYLGVDIPLSL
jgi:hypothetical protein